MDTTQIFVLDMAPVRFILDSELTPSKIYKRAISSNVLRGIRNESKIFRRNFLTCDRRRRKSTVQEYSVHEAAQAA